ncbi:MAG: 4-phosphoerythronate dehydrogenase [Muribaculaceae bacterium]|nr:4-phosphoerythronate dehydrogenase [Muribaculaceae bacterium]
MKIVADSKIPYLKGVLEQVAQEVLYVPGNEITSDVVRDADVLLTRTRTRCDCALLEGSKLEFIGTATIGTDHIDLDYCHSHGITVVNAPGCNAPAVAQWVHATILQWMQANHVTHPITLGVVGVGHVGSIVARWAQQLGYRILLNDPPLAECYARGSGIGDRESGNDLSTLHSPPSTENHSQLSTLHCLQHECDIITFHTPLTKDGKYPTWHLCDKAFLQGLKHCELILNAARGAVCDNEALLRWQGDVALDCWENEPAISQELLDKAFVATPHIAGYSRQGKMRGTAMVIEALNRYFGWNLPVPEVDKPLLGANDMTPQLIMDSYNPLHDTATLKAAPHLFESLRNNYLLREEV